MGKSQPRIRSLAIVVLALVTFVNTYTEDLFGDHVGTVWEVVDGLVIALSAVVGLSLWKCGCASGRVVAVISVATGVLVFTNYLFVNNETLWTALDPVMILVALTWAAAALSPTVGAPGGGD